MFHKLDVLCFACTVVVLTEFIVFLKIAPLTSIKFVNNPRNNYNYTVYCTKNKEKCRRAHVQNMEYYTFCENVIMICECYVECMHFPDSNTRLFW